MIHKFSRLLLTLVALFAMTAGAWADDTYTVTFSGFGNENCNKTVTDATLEYSETFNVTDVYANYIMLGGVGGSNEYVSISKSQDETQITITVKSAFEGTVNVTVYYQNEYWDETQSDISVTCVKSAPSLAVTWNAATKQATFAMPAYDVELIPEYYPGMLTFGSGAIEGGKLEVVGMTDTDLPEGFEKDAEGNIYVAKDTKFTVKATPDTGYYLVGWSDDETNKEMEREITMGDDDLTLTPTFAQMPVLTLAQSDATMGIVTVEGAGGTASIGPKEEIKSNNNFVGEYYQVTGGGTNASYRQVGNSDNSTITIESLNGEIINNLTLEVYTASVWGGYSIATTSGTVSGDPENNAYIYVTDINATSVTLSRTGTGAANGTVGFSKFTVNGIEDAAPAAPANIFPVEGEDGKYYVIPGSEITLKAVPAEGYHFVCWSDDAENTNPEREITMPADGSDLSLSATFAENEYNITFSEGTNPDPENPEWTATPNPAKTKQTVTVTYTGTKKVIGVKAEKKSSAPTLKDALADGATVVITYTWMGGTNVTTFTYTKNGDEYTGSTTGDDAEYFANDMSKEGTTLKFTASNPDHSAANVSIDFDTDTNEYVASKGGYFTSFTISVNGTDVTSQLKEVK